MSATTKSEKTMDILDRAFGPEDDPDEIMDYGEYKYTCECLLEEDEARSVVDEYVAFWPECPEHNEPIKPEVLADMKRGIVDVADSSPEASRSIGDILPNFPLTNVHPVEVADYLETLSEAATHLLRDHDCDVHGYEVIKETSERALVLAARLRAPQEEAGRDHPCDGFGPNGSCSECTGLIARDDGTLVTDDGAIYEPRTSPEAERDDPTIRLKMIKRDGGDGSDYAAVADALSNEVLTLRSERTRSRLRSQEEPDSNEYRPWEEDEISECEYYKRRYLELRASQGEAETLGYVLVSSWTDDDGVESSRVLWSSKLYLTSREGEARLALAAPSTATRERISVEPVGARPSAPETEGVFRTDRAAGSWLHAGLREDGVTRSVDDCQRILGAANKRSRERPNWGQPGEPGGLGPAPEES